MVDFLNEAVAALPRHEALTDGDRSWSYAELEAVVDTAAQRLAGLGAGPGRAVAVVLPPSPEAVVAVHAVLRTGGLLAPLEPSLTAPELAGAFGALQPALVLAGADPDAAARTARAAGSGRAGSVLPPEVWFPRPAPETGVDAGLDEAGAPSGPEEGLGDRFEDEGPPAGPPPEGAVVVLWTSGTEGARRGVLLGAAGLRHAAEASRARLGLGPGDRWHASLSVAHVGGLALVLRAAHTGATLMADGPFQVERFSRRVQEGGVTHASLVPVMLRRCLDSWGARPAPATLRCVLVGGAACPRPLVERARDGGLPVALTYGLTEATSQVATAPPDLVRRKPGTVGPPLGGIELRIAGNGEVLVRGPTVAPGLLGGKPVTGPDGWLHTGDLGELDEEGHLWVTGRLSDRIVTGGVTVDPAEVEAVLLRHPGVDDAAVVGVPDAEWGERIVAAVVPAGGKSPEGSTSYEEALRAWVRKRLSGARTPKAVVAVAAIPRTATGKVDRRALKDMVG